LKTPRNDDVNHNLSYVPAVESEQIIKSTFFILSFNFFIY